MIVCYRKKNYGKLITVCDEISEDNAIATDKAHRSIVNFPIFSKSANPIQIQSKCYSQKIEKNISMK